jgi:uncharacterized protein (UPF0276 family)
MENSYKFGFEWVSELESDILGALDEHSCVEIIPESFFDGRFNSFLEKLANRGTPVAIHGVLMSIGSADPLDELHLDKVISVAKRVNTINFSEHLSLCSVAGVSLDALTPIAWNKDVIELVCRKIDRIQTRFDLPFSIENVANRFTIPDCDYTETEFINRIIKKTGCGLLLDVTNVYTNSINFGYDPFRWIDNLSLDALKLVHLAGGFHDPDGFLMDSHDNKVPDEVWDLYHHVCRKAPPFMTIIERTGNFPDFKELSGELSRAQAIVSEVKASQEKGKL